MITENTPGTMATSPIAEYKQIMQNMQKYAKNMQN